MAKIFLREIKTGRLARLQYLGYSSLLELLMFGFGFAVVLVLRMSSFLSEQLLKNVKFRNAIGKPE